jgi:hypothetical protein
MPKVKGRPAAPVKKKTAARGRPSGKVATRQNILRAAIEVFATHGFAGGRVELETIYKELGDAEAALDLEGLDAEKALREIVRFTWTHYRAHPEMLAVLSNENLHQGKHVARSKHVKALSFPLMSILDDVLARGVKQKTFRSGIEARDLYIAMCSLGYFYLSNKFTLSAFLGVNLMADSALDHWRDMMETVILRFVQRPAPA